MLARRHRDGPGPPMPNGYIIFSGPSELDGAPIIAVATGFSTSSSNRKTGPGLVQTWILRADINPVQALQTGADGSICGPCPMRGAVEAGRVRVGVAGGPGEHVGPRFAKVEDGRDHEKAPWPVTST